MSKEIKEVLQDFAGGLNILAAPNRIAPNQLVDCLNMYYDNNSLLSRNGATNTSILTIDVNTVIGATFAPFKLLNTWLIGTGSGGVPVEQLFLIGIDNSQYNVCCKYTPDGSTFYNVALTAQSINTTNGSPIVTGNGTSWLTLPMSVAPIGLLSG